MFYSSYNYDIGTTTINCEIIKSSETTQNLECKFLWSFWWVECTSNNQTCGNILLFDVYQV